MGSYYNADANTDAKPLQVVSFNVSGLRILLQRRRARFESGMVAVPSETSSMQRKRLHLL